MESPTSSESRDRVVRNDVAAMLSRRQLIHRGGALGLAALVAGAIPAAEVLSRATRPSRRNRISPTPPCRPSGTRSSRAARPASPISATRSIPRPSPASIPTRARWRPIPWPFPRTRRRASAPSLRPSWPTSRLARSSRVAPSSTSTTRLARQWWSAGSPSATSRWSGSRSERQAELQPERDVLGFHAGLRIAAVAPEHSSASGRKSPSPCRDSR